MDEVEFNIRSNFISSIIFTTQTRITNNSLSPDFQSSLDRSMGGP